jgi:hypothetical protein
MLLQPLLNFRVPAPVDLAGYGNSSPDGSASCEGWPPLSFSCWTFLLTPLALEFLVNHS